MFKLTKGQVILLVIMAVSYIANNFVHAVTPELIKSINAPKWMNGSYYAVMALGGFLFVPIFGKLSDVMGRKKLFIIGMCFYIIGQLMFGLATDPYLIHIYRLISGVGGPTFLMLLTAAVSDHTSKKQMTKMMIYIALLRQLGSGLGKWIGGIFGIFGYHFVFNMQVIVLILVMLLAYIFFPSEDDFIKKHEHDKLSSKALFLDSFSWVKVLNAKFMLSAIGLFLSAYFWISMAKISFDNNVIFFINDSYHMSSLISGNYMLVLSFVSIISLMIITPFLVKYLQEHKIIFLATLIAVIFLALAVVFNDISHIITAILSLLYYLCATIIEGLVNGYALKISNMSRGFLLSLIQSFSFIGTVVGALFSGYLFGENAIFPFIFSIIVLCISLMIFTIHRLRYRNERKKEISHETN